MFEKEADLAETEMLIHCHGDYSKKKNYREGWQEGATFGYNKANEWHYVKDGDFPPEELEKENAELKRQVEQKQHLADVRLEQSLENYKLFSDERKARIDVDVALDDTTDQLTYAKTIIQDLLENTDEYARQKAEDFLKENKQL